MGPATRPLDAATLVGLLADDDRRQVFAAVELGATTVEAIAAATSLPGVRVTQALGRLVSAGLVIAEGDVLKIAGAAFQAAACEARRGDRAGEQTIGPDVSADAQKVLRAFVAGGRLQSIPTARSKRLVVLDWLAQDFEIGRRYSEAQVNLILGKRHADTAALRRYLVDEGFVDRAGGEYWRCGGTT